MALLRRLYARSHLTVNEAKSAVVSVFGRKFLGYCLRAGPKGAVKRAVASKPMATFKQRIRQLSRRSGGRSLHAVVQRLRPYLLGWKSYFGLAQTPKVWRALDEWLRHRLLFGPCAMVRDRGQSAKLFRTGLRCAWPATGPCDKGSPSRGARRWSVRGRRHIPPGNRRWTGTVRR